MITEVRAVIYFFYLLDRPGEGILARPERAYGEGIVNLRIMWRWISKFRNGKADLDDEPKPERPRRNKKCR
jgi:hypothetical protein